MRKLLTAGLLGVWVGSLSPLYAASTFVDVVPETLTSQPLTFSVTAESDEHDTVHFDVFVSTGHQAISPYREGRFEIARDHVVPRRRGEAGELPRPIVYCSVRELNDDGALHFRFGLERRLVPKATFQFRNYDPNGMPSMDVFRFVLSAFVADE